MRAARLLVGLWLAAGGGLGLLPSLAAPAEPAPGTYDYRIRHGLFGDIGEHHVTVRREAGAVVSNTRRSWRSSSSVSPRSSGAPAFARSGGTTA